MRMPAHGPCPLRTRRRPRLALLLAPLALGCQARAQSESDELPSHTVAAAATAAGDPAAAQDAPVYGFGRTPTAAEIAAWDLDVGPDGAGLPSGSGTVREGLALYAESCATCHGADGTGGTFEALAGRVPGDAFDFATEPGRRSTVGSYWPYATTLFDYMRRAMPFDSPGTLTDTELYGLVGAVLYLNDLVELDAVIDSAAVANVVMPSRDRFVPDDREPGPVIR